MKYHYKHVLKAYVFSYHFIGDVMLKKKAFRRILITTVALFIVLFVYTFVLKEDKTVIYDEAYYISSEDKRSIYCLNKDDYVSKTSIYVDKELSLEDKVRSILETMTMENNKNSLLPSYFQPILPPNTKVLDVILDNDVLRVYFSLEFLEATSEQSTKMIEAITYSLLEFDDVLGVEIYVNGKLLEYAPNTNKKLPVVLTKDIGINKVYQIDSNKDISKVVLYYLTKDEESTYYVPVTKYVNDEREKLEIIVDSLANEYFLDSSLISYLNVKTELVSYDILEDSIMLYFNEDIYDDASTEYIKDEALNALVYSVFANYDTVENLKIMVLDKEVFSSDRNIMQSI